MGWGNRCGEDNLRAFRPEDGEMAIGRRHAAWMKTIDYPQSGWAKTAREAVRMVEEQYDNLKVRNGIAA